MKRIAKAIYVLLLVALVGVPGIVMAHDPGRAGESRERPSAPGAQPAMDPLMQALLIGLAASVLREAAASPDPVTTFGDSLERKLMFALRSPELARLLDQLIAQAVRETPQELREPLAQFTAAMLETFRREMLDRQARRQN